jgi:protein-tyrosine-phosphatase
MSAAFFNQLVDPNSARAISAGTHPADRVHPVVVEAMQEVGIDLSEAKPQKLTAELAQNAQMLITMGCGDECRFAHRYIMRIRNVERNLCRGLLCIVRTSQEDNRPKPGQSGEFS